MFDAWGNILKVQDVTGRTLSGLLVLDRGYTGHEHLQSINIIHMNGRLYDPVVHRFLQPDNFIQDPFNTQFFNRYGYCLNNPFMYTDPSGEFLTAAVIIGAVVGAYFGGVAANGGEFNPGKWNWNGKTIGHMIGGAIVGAFSGGAANQIATSGVVFANTKAILIGSAINGIGTNIYTGGQSEVMLSLGVVSLNFSRGEFGYLGKKGNSFLENLGYGLGAVANFNDFMTGFKPENIGNVELVTEHSDVIGHSALVEPGTMDHNSSIVSFGPDGGAFTKNPFGSTPGDTAWGNYTSTNKPIWRTTISGINKNRVLNYGLDLSNKTPNYNLYFGSCVTHTSVALAKSGFLNIGIHPYLLHAQVALRDVGLRTYYGYYLQK